jgi:hypothetical protein
MRWRAGKEREREREREGAREGEEGGEKRANTREIHFPVERFQRSHFFII